MKRLARMLDIPHWGAVGIMESLWNLTAKETPTGQIGKLSNEDIAMQLDWRGNADELVQALLGSGWLDISEDLRLLVHDWHEHADNAVHASLARRCERFASGEIPKSGELNKPERARFNNWLEKQGLDRRPAGRPAENQTESSDMADKSRVKTGENHVPVPVPVPLPVPNTNTPPSARKPEPEPTPESASEPDWVGDEPPAGLNFLAYSRGMLETLCIPLVMATQQAAAAAIEAFGKEHGLEKHRATAELTKLARDALQRGEAVDKWWFTDRKWGRKGGGNGAATANRAQERVDGTRGAFRKAAERRGVVGVDGFAGPDGPGVSPSAAHGGNGGGMAGGHRAAGGSVRGRESADGAGGFSSDAGPEILPPSERDSGSAGGAYGK